MLRPLLSLAFAAALSGCTFAAAPSAPSTEPAITLTAEGPPSEVAPQESTAELQWAASVTEVNFLENQGGSAGVKLFGSAGGDPAMNGLQTHIAFFQSPADGWAVFRIGDFLTYRVLSDSPGRVDLEISESTLNAESGEIGSRTYYAIVTWTLGADGGAPTTVTMTPATAG